MAYIFVTGGIISGLGKGIVTASILRILKSRGYKVTAIKIDPYVNVDAGTLRPTEHGEVWVTEEGGETDEDLGHYERFICESLTKDHNITTGKIYYSVIEKERKGEYLGKTVQLIPHITDEIKNCIKNVAKKTNSEIVLIEIGGIVGDYENIIFLEAARQLNREEKVVFVHVSYVPIPNKLGEPKTKPTQQSVKLLRELGIQPDFIICRSRENLDEVRKQKISLFCDIPKENIIDDPDIETVYELPLIFEKQNLSKKILNKLNLSEKTTNFLDLKEWEERTNILKQKDRIVKIGIVGKYIGTGNFKLADSYISVEEAVKHACAFLGYRPEIVWIDSTRIELNLPKIQGIIIPGGFGTTGIEGKLKTITYCRENNIPFLGLCLGLQLAVIEFARNVCGLKDANSTEIDENTKNPVIDILPEQRDIIKNKKYGATMRLGVYPAVLKEGTKVYNLYKKFNLIKNNIIFERHRHRYELNPEYHKILQNNGMIFSGFSPDGKLVEFIELPNHKFFVATQAHPEFKSNLLNPSPLFYGFVESCLK
ncbi:MAG TPA: CTP synthase (glutamine hydrolyzing) [Candidatus Aenigmarchaeota archaeon]|nr:CTP synthase (glutamine hydrolyzing) [Candidatus Aenigmarchaeota archaeon]